VKGEDSGLSERQEKVLRTPQGGIEMNAVCCEREFFITLRILVSPFVLELSKALDFPFRPAILAQYQF
jgi:hypothetical protein